MAMENSHLKDSVGASPLGKAVTYRDTYAPELLFPISRQLKRDEIGVAAGALPFIGQDIWNAYELSWLDARGKPWVAIGCFRVPADSPNLIESKSLKLYLNSLNQTHFADVQAVQTCLQRDLSNACGAPVLVELSLLAERPCREFAYPQGTLLDTLDIEVDTYTLQPGFLQVDEAAGIVEETLHSHLLKSNCLVTGQPDWGMVVIHYRGRRIDHAGLLRYIISFRSHNEFHEQCVERIFCDVLRYCQPEALTVYARYTRRGGLDINPYRSNEPLAGLVANAGEVRQ